VRAAFLLSEEARLAKLPSISITAGVGGSSELSDLVGDLGAGLFAPLYTGGALEAALDGANADQEAAVAAYGQAILRSFEEVENALMEETLLAERVDLLREAAEENRKAWEAARVQYDVGKTDLLSVLQMQARWVGARVSLIHVENERLLTRVNLHLALGGSFEVVDQEEAPAEPPAESQ
jgi:outer membrane protein TolC